MEIVLQWYLSQMSMSVPCLVVCSCYWRILFDGIYLYLSCLCLLHDWTSKACLVVMPPVVNSCSTSIVLVTVFHLAGTTIPSPRAETRRPESLYVGTGVPVFLSRNTARSRYLPPMSGSHRTALQSILHLHLRESLQQGIVTSC